MSAQLARDDEEASTPAADTPGDPAASFGLTPIQHWFFEQDLAAPQHWNMSVCVRVPERLDPGALAAAVHAVVERHPMLRARFARDKRTHWQQRIGEWNPQQFAHEDLPCAEHAQRMTQWQRSLDLRHGPVFRALYLSEPDVSEGRLLLVAHHLVVDGVSWRQLLDDLQQAYRACVQGQTPVLSAPGATFAHWQRFLTEGLEPRRLQQWRDYWSQFDAGEPFAPLPFKACRNRECDSDTLHTRLDRETTARLLGDGPRAFRTQPQELLLAALAIALASLCGDRRVSIELEGHGREPLDSGLDLSGVVGWFTTRYPAFLRLPDDSTPEAALAAVKDQLRAIPDRGLGYGVLRYLHGELREVPAAQVCFNYLGQVRTGGESNSWRFADGFDGGSRDPETPRRHLLDVGALVVDGELGIDWTWPREAVARDVIAKLSERYLDALAVLLDLGATHAERITHGEVPLAGLDERAFARLARHYSDLEDVYPASPLQEGLLFHAIDAQDEAVYVNQTTVTLEGAFDSAAFAQAWRQVIARHAILRTGFVWDGLERPLQLVRNAAALAVREVDLQGSDEATITAALTTAQHEDRHEPFDLDQPPLMRVRLLRCNAQRHIVVWTRHHLIVDGWSSALLIQEVLAVYHALANGHMPVLPPPPAYREYLGWLQRQDSSEAEAWWRNELAGIDTPARLPEVQNPQPGFVQLRRDLELSDVVALAASHHVTVGTVLQGALALVLHRYYGRDDFIIGLTSSGRPAELPEVERILGVFINTLPLRIRITPSANLGDWLTELHRHGQTARTYEHLPLARVQALSGLPGGTALLDTLLVLENYPAATTTSDSGLRMREHDSADLTHYPLTLAMVAEGHRLHMQVSLDRSRIDAWLVEQLLDDLAFVLAQLPSLASPQALPPLPSQSPAETPRLSLADDT
ncbi:hypothetical protein EBB59_13100, partial [Lysobacter pythonis]